MMRLSVGGSKHHARRSRMNAYPGNRCTVRLLYGLSFRVNSWRLASGRGVRDVRWIDYLVGRNLASKKALNERRGFGESARACEAHCLNHLVRIQHVIHVHKTFVSEPDQASARGAHLSY